MPPRRQAKAGGRGRGRSKGRGGKGAGTAVNPPASPAGPKLPKKRGIVVVIPYRKPTTRAEARKQQEAGGGGSEPPKKEGSKDPSPAPKKPSPAPKSPGPAPKSPSPAPKGPSPAPKGPSPAPKGSSPAPKSPSPAPKKPSPAPKDPSPAPKDPSPAPKKSSPTPKEPKKSGKQKKLKGPPPKSPKDEAGPKPPGPGAPAQGQAATDAKKGTKRGPAEDPPGGAPAGKKARTEAGPTAEQSELSEVLERAYYAELETVRRRKPLLDPGDPRNTIAHFTVQAPPNPPPGGPETVDLTQGGDGDGEKKRDRVGGAATVGPAATPARLVAAKGIPRAPEGKKVEQDPPGFYGLKDGEEHLLRFQDRVNHRGEIPAPLAGTRLLARAIQEKERIRPATEADMDRLFDQRDLYAPRRQLRDLDEAFCDVWFRDRADGVDPLVAGLPLVENVVFFRPANFGGSRADCFYKAVAYQVYGTHEWADRVKAEHMYHVYNVLLPGPDGRRHARRERYAAMNRRFFATVIEGAVKDEAGERRWQTVANLYQQLHIPHVYTAADMFEITADLYGVFIVVFVVDGRRKVVKDCYARGCYNARHLLFLYDETIKHFQPLVANDFEGGEYKYRRIMLADTLKFPGLGSTRIKADGRLHKWRGGSEDFHKSGVPPPIPVDHAWYLDFMRHVYNGTSKEL